MLSFIFISFERQKKRSKEKAPKMATLTFFSARYTWPLLTPRHEKGYKFARIFGLPSRR
jgi:hypothetical protein